MMVQGHRAALIFCVLHAGIEEVSAAADIDPEYACQLAVAMDAGLEVFTLLNDISPRGIYPQKTTRLGSPNAAHAHRSRTLLGASQAALRWFVGGPRGRRRLPQAGKRAANEGFDCALHRPFAITTVRPISLTRSGSGTVPLAMMQGMFSSGRRCPIRNGSRRYCGFRLCPGLHGITGVPIWISGMLRQWGTDTACP